MEEDDLVFLKTNKKRFWKEKQALVCEINSLKENLNAKAQEIYYL